MAYRSLRDFIARLEGEGRLSRVSAPVSPHLEMTEIQTRLIAEEGRRCCSRMSWARPDALRHAGLVNLFGTVERVAWGMNREPDALREVGETWPSCASRSRRAAGARRSRCCRCSTRWRDEARAVGDGPVQEVVLTGDDIDLARLPIQTCWPGEPAPLITWPLVGTKGPSKSRIDNYNLGIYRMQVTAGTRR